MSALYHEYLEERFFGDLASKWQKCYNLVESMIFQKYIVEIRYEPNPAFLDKRGELTKKLISDDFKNWLVQDNRVDLVSKHGNVFASFSNMGFTLNEKNELEKFIEKFDQLLKEIGDVPPIRWGVRILTIKSSTKNFPKLVSNYRESFLNFKPESFAEIDGQLIDVGVSYEIEKDHNIYHLSSGPMKRNQALEVFQVKKEKLPERGIFVDLDIYRKGEMFFGADYRRSRMIDFVRDSFSKGEKIISDFLGGIDG